MLAILQVVLCKDFDEVVGFLKDEDCTTRPLKPPTQKAKLVPIVVKTSSVLNQKMLFDLLYDLEDVLLNAEDQEVADIGE